MNGNANEEKAASATQHGTTEAMPTEKAPQHAPSDLARHQRKCTICHHPDQSMIEREFIDWRRPDDIGQCYNVSGRAIYRHARASRLYEQRARNARFSLAWLIENATRVEINADSIIRAVCAYAHITDDGRWVEPPVARPSAQAPTSAAAMEPPACRDSDSLIVTAGRSQTGATR